MGFFWDQIRNRLQKIFKEHPPIVFWALELGPQTNEGLGHEILHQEIHKLIHLQSDSDTKTVHIHRLIEYYRSHGELHKAILEAQLLKDDFFDAWLDGAVLMHQFTPNPDPKEELVLLNEIYNFRVEQHRLHPEWRDIDTRDDDETRLWIARNGINPWIGERFGLDRILLHRFRQSLTASNLHGNLTDLFEGLPHRARLYPSHGRPTVKLDGLQKHLETLAESAAHEWLVQSNLLDYWDEFKHLIHNKFDHQHRPIRTRLWRKIQLETNTIRKLDAMITLHRIDANPVIAREILTLFEEVGEQYTKEYRCVEVIRHFSAEKYKQARTGLGKTPIPTACLDWKIFKDIQWLLSDRLDPEIDFSRHKLGFPPL